MSLLLKCILTIGSLILLSSCDERDKDALRQDRSTKSVRSRPIKNSTEGDLDHFNQAGLDVFQDMIRRARSLPDVLRDVAEYQDKEVVVEGFWINSVEGAWIAGDAEEPLMSTLSVMGIPENLYATGGQLDSLWDLVHPFNRIIVAGTLRIGDYSGSMIELKNHPYLELKTVVSIDHDPEETLYYGSDSSTSDLKSGVTELTGHAWMRKGSVIVDGFGDPQSSIQIDQHENRVLSMKGAVSSVRAEEYVSGLVEKAQPILPLSEFPSLEIGQEVVLKATLEPSMKGMQLLTPDGTVIWHAFQSSETWHVSNEAGLGDIRQSREIGKKSEVVVHGRIERLGTEPTLRLRTVVYLEAPNDAARPVQKN